VTVSTDVVVDTSRCQAYGLCVAIAPDVFDVPPGSPVAVVLESAVAQETVADVEEAVRSCPAQALTLRRSGLQ
jgi:ferredoxin